MRHVLDNAWYGLSGDPGAAVAVLLAHSECDRTGDNGECQADQDETAGQSSDHGAHLGFVSLHGAIMRQAL